VSTGNHREERMYFLSACCSCLSQLWQFSWHQQGIENEYSLPSQFNYDRIYCREEENSVTTWLIEIENIMYQYSQWKGNAFFPLTQEHGFLIAFAKRKTITHWGWWVKEKLKCEEQ
jgi:hypothetical protein